MEIKLSVILLLILSLIFSPAKLPYPIEAFTAIDYCELLAVESKDVDFLSYRGAHYWIEIFPDDKYEEIPLGIGSLCYPKFTDFQALEPLSRELACLLIKDENSNVIASGNLTNYVWRPDRVEVTFKTSNNMTLKIVESFTSPNVIVAKVILRNLERKRRDVEICVYTSGSNKAFEHLVSYDADRDSILYKQHAIYDHYWILKIVGFGESYSHGIYEEYDSLIRDFQDNSLLNSLDKKDSYSKALVGGIGYKVFLTDRTEFYIVIALSYEGWEKSFSYAAPILENLESAFELTTQAINKYLNSVPRLECSDSEIERMYYMSWFTLWYNTYQPHGYWKYEVITPSKSWNPWPIGGYARGVWLWDSAFHALALRYYDPEMAKNQIKQFIKLQREDGKIHREIWIDQIWPRENSPNTQPPGILTLTAYWLYLQTGDREFLAECYRAFKEFNEWWYKEQDLDRDGLCEWPSGGDSGLDNLPAWDLGAYLYDAVDLNCWLYLDQVTLSKMAEALSLYGEAEKWRRKADETRQLINEKLYDPQAETYANVMIKNSRYPEGEGKFFKIRTIINFWPLWAGVATRERADKIVNKYLTNSEEFWAPYPLRTVSKREGYPFYDDSPQGYWRGSVWIASNWLIIQGLYNYGYSELATQLAYKTLKLIARNNVPRERYDPETGEPTGAYFFAWTAALYIDILIRNIIGYDPASDILNLKSNLPEQISYISLSIVHRERKYKIVLNSTTTLGIFKKNQPLLSTQPVMDVAVIDDNYSDGRVEFEVRGKGILVIDTPYENSLLNVYVNDIPQVLKTDEEGLLRIEVEKAAKIVVTISHDEKRYTALIPLLLVISALAFILYKWRREKSEQK
ncbi:MAG: hypothetical protein DRJ37_03120 [Thermoprotei archaeon]|nr:MAG: hypothetical protein DRJ37_03120 [Thermoprotei archaeon]